MMEAEDVLYLRVLAVRAGQKIAGHYKDFDGRVERKSDNTPVTVADKASHDCLLEGLKARWPEVPVLSEEGEIPDFAVRKTWQRYWLLDPLDGTREFVDQTDEFCICLALIEDGKAVFGLVHAPVTQEMYYGQQEEGAFSCEAENTRCLKTTAPELPWRCLVSRRHDPLRWKNMWPSSHPIILTPCGSALKFCRLASGQGDFYLRHGPTHEWDTAAGQAILEAAGGQVLDLKGRPFRYNQKPSTLNEPFVAKAHPSLELPLAIK